MGGLRLRGERRAGVSVVVTEGASTAVVATSPYDDFAWVYNRHWRRFSVRAEPVIEDLVLRRLRQGSHIVDLCCGTGQLAAALVRRGYRVTGLDSSAEMLRFARENAPAGEFVLADARNFRLPEQVDAVLAMSDSVNHFMSVEDLVSAFTCAYCSLRGGVFLFDVNTEEKYLHRWTGSFSISEADHALVVRASYEPELVRARFDATVFRLEGEWRRTDLTIYERCFSADEITNALSAAGFDDIQVFDWRRDLDPEGEPAKLFFRARKPAGEADAARG